MSRIAITGAGGFLGRAAVRAARAAGHEVTALVRRDGAILPDWRDDGGLSVHAADLAGGGDAAAALRGADVVIHAAAGSGGDAAHARDTLQATDALLDALPQGARLVLVSSFSVYAVTGMPAGATLDETSPVDRDPRHRDAYARAKIAQEGLAIARAQTGGLDLWIMRPGAIWGPGRTWTARLGWRRGARVVCPGGDVPVPAIHVETCAAGLVAAAFASDAGWPDDLPVLSGGGRIRIVNLVDPDPPAQSDWLAAAGHRRVLRLPPGPLMKGARALDLAGDLWPAFGRRIPTGLREATLAARFRPLRYSAARAQDRLGLAAGGDFAARMRGA
ncbi:hypothetical protein OCGS_2590 [Oceaniovalibus guishaninsula JLT2003]|uniref:NAD-dependent epimerase/dehydratase domain-containing protein n=1 Tax=Oceaniovalibus guishaninsula JLT2003 TaxID=1231392 RepID=K2H6J7_9RHOB|nr:NAD(P)-dependent oxidoreductase [Oceaniovalibus guishaninsula]EKE43253.1 hypothetical protein OCGS_2590 [Oceaniovalibus guishaninsula JLT2003]